MFAKVASQIRSFSPLTREFLGVLAFLLLVSLVIGVTDADLFFSGLFYSPERGWMLGQTQPWRFLYQYGMVPAFLLAVAGLVVLVVGFFAAKPALFRRHAAYFVLLLILGPGLLVNAVFKDHWGRPRPANIVDFGGTESFRPCWLPGEMGKGKSFPSGHASVGFYLVAPYFILRKEKKALAFFFLGLGIFYGSLMGMGRIIQGGHFLSDVLWSGGILYLTALILSQLLGLTKEKTCSSNLLK
jgi:membrane-associated PAP2 superfamily phosphatase